MSHSTETRILQATKCLKLRNISLYEARFSRPESVVEAQVEGVQQSKLSVRFSVGEVVIDDAAVRLLQVHVDLGTRVVRTRSDEATDEVLFLIEADYLVEYELIDDLEDDAIKAFAEFNAVHNVWPFWRHHVFDIVQRGRLPPFEVPLFSGRGSSKD